MTPGKIYNKKYKKGPFGTFLCHLFIIILPNSQFPTHKSFPYSFLVCREYTQKGGYKEKAQKGDPTVPI